MKINQLTCPACGATVSAHVAPNQQFTCSACRSILVLTDVLAADQLFCGQCSTLNPLTNRFCLRCGGVLQQACPFCQVTNPISHDHCRACGVNLHGARQRHAQWLAEERQHAAARAHALEQSKATTQAAQLVQWIADLKEPDNHPWAIYCLNRLGAEAVEPLIQTLRHDPDPDARFGAAHALGQIGDRRAIPALCQALADPEAAVRYWAVDALMRLQAENSANEIARLLTDPHAGVRTHAQVALNQLRPPGDMPASLLQKWRSWLD